jgi:hypothetical protein
MFDTVPTDLISLAEAATLVVPLSPGRPTSPSTIRRWIRQGKLRGWEIRPRGRDGRATWGVSRAELLSFIRPVPVALAPGVRDRIETDARARETDRILRAMRVRR